MEKMARQVEKDRLEKERLEARKRREIQRITDVNLFKQKILFLKLPSCNSISSRT